MIAYYYDLPVIASDIDGFKERVIDGENGLLFKNKSVEDLRDRIMKAADMTIEERSEMKRKLKEFSEENFSLSKVSGKYIKYFKSITL